MADGDGRVLERLVHESARIPRRRRRSAVCGLISPRAVFEPVA